MKNEKIHVLVFVDFSTYNYNSRVSSDYVQLLDQCNKAQTKSLLTKLQMYGHNIATNYKITEKIFQTLNVFIRS